MGPSTKGFRRRKAPSLVAAGIRPHLLLRNRSVRSRDPQAVTHTSRHTHCIAYRHTHPSTPPPTQCCVTSLTTQRLPSLLAPVIAQEEQLLEGGLLRAPHRTAEDIPPLGTHYSYIQEYKPLSHSSIHPATPSTAVYPFTKYAGIWPEDVLSQGP